MENQSEKSKRESGTSIPSFMKYNQNTDLNEIYKWVKVDDNIDSPMKWKQSKKVSVSVKSFN